MVFKSKKEILSGKEMECEEDMGKIKKCKQRSRSIQTVLENSISNAMLALLFALIFFSFCIVFMLLFTSTYLCNG